MAASFTLISRHWRTPDRTSDTLLRRAASRARCITKEPKKTPTTTPRSRRTVTSGGRRDCHEGHSHPERRYSCRVLSHDTGTAIHPSSSPAIISSRRLAYVVSSADFVFRCPVDPHCAAAGPPSTRINPFNWDHPYPSKRRVDPRPDWTTAGGAIKYSDKKYCTQTKKCPIVSPYPGRSRVNVYRRFMSDLNITRPFQRKSLSLCVYMSLGHRMCQ